MIKFAPGGRVELEQNLLCGKMSKQKKIKAVTAYFGDLVQQ